MNVILGRTPKHLIEEAVDEHRWYSISCRPDCANVGPWLVHGPATHELYLCARCRREMKVDVVEGP